MKDFSGKKEIKHTFSQVKKGKLKKKGNMLLDKRESKIQEKRKHANDQDKRKKTRSSFFLL